MPKTTPPTEPADADKRRVGRPAKECDAGRIAYLAAINCSQEEIAADQDCSVDTLTRNFAEALEKGKSLCSLSLKAKQFQLAMGRPAQAAKYLRVNTDEKGNPIGELALDKHGQPIKVLDEQPEWKPNVTLLIWLGKQYAGQSDKVSFGKGEGFDIGPPGGP